MTDLVQIPGTGELVDVKSATTDRLAEAHDEIKNYANDLRSFARQIDDELIARMDYEGKRTYHGDGFTLEAGKPTERKWDMDRLDVVLARLVREETISPLKAQRCIRVKREANAVELRTLENDPRCTHAIRSCYEDVPATRSLRVKR